MAQDRLSILISGGGIAGPCLAWWLRKRSNAAITVIERFPKPRTSGQAVDIRDVAVDIIREMGLEETIRSKHTTEEGMEFVYADGVTKAQFPATGDTESQGFTSEFEILRGDLARVFYDATKDFDGLDYVFDEYITSISEQEQGGRVEVTFANHLPKTEYDLVVGADGMISNTRRQIWGKGPDKNDYLKSLGQYMAFFTIPREEEDSKFARWYNAPGGRLEFLRPSPYPNETRVHLAVSDPNLSRFDGIAKAMGKGRDAQMEWLEKEMAGASRQTPRLLEGMRQSEDFYMQQIAQVKLDNFVNGRVALVGDADYCPSPLSGMGTSISIIGAYVLAGEMARITSTSDIPAALTQYQTIMRPIVDNVQSVIPGAPHIANPQTKLGIRILNSVTGFGSLPLVKKIATAVGETLSGWLPKAFHSTKFTLPRYDM